MLLAAFLPAPGTCASFDVAMIGATTIGFALVLAAPLLTASAREHRRVLLVAYAIGFLLALALQLVTARPRPSGIPLVPMPALPSFPSGHAVLVAIAVGWVATARDRIAPLLAVAAVLVAVSRVHVGHHFASDVVGGLLVGMPIGIAARGHADDRGAVVPRLGRLLGPQIGLIAAISVLASVGGLSADRVPLLSVPGIDKVLHLLVFGVLGFFGCFVMIGGAVGRGLARVKLPILLPCAIACTEEALQVASPHRSVDVLDLTCDFAGILLGVALGRRIVERRASAALACAPLVSRRGDERMGQTSPPENP